MIITPKYYAILWIQKFRFRLQWIQHLRITLWSLCHLWSNVSTVCGSNVQRSVALANKDSEEEDY